MLVYILVVACDTHNNWPNFYCCDVRFVVDIKIADEGK